MVRIVPDSRRTSPVEELTRAQPAIVNTTFTRFAVTEPDGVYTVWSRANNGDPTAADGLVSEAHKVLRISRGVCPFNGV